MLKKIISLLVVCFLVIGLGAPAYAAEIGVVDSAIIIKNDESVRVAVYGDVVATFDKNANIMYVKDGENEFSFSMDATENSGIIPYANTTIKEESVALHRYEYNRTDSGSYYWAVDIPSYAINPNNWCGWISVWDDGSAEGNYAEEFADYIDAAQDDEHTIAIYGGAAAVTAIVGLATKNPVYSASAFKAVCAAAGVAVSYGLLEAASSYFNNLDNARENYFAIRELVG